MEIGTPKKPNIDLSLKSAINEIKDICRKSEGRLQYFPYGGSGYKASITHYFESSTDVAGGAVQPGTEKDLQEIMKIINTHRVNFAVKCGGHSTNPGFSSTDGIQIYLIRFNEIEVDKERMRVRVGAGCLFEELYRELDSYGINIVGGSGLAGVGVAGWMLGGGYSVKTSQHGLGVDNLAGAKVVLPDGRLLEASETVNKDLFFAIKGGCNNFGIVTEFTLIAHEQGLLHDFTLTFKHLFIEAKAAIVKIIDRQDKKANIEATFRHHGKQGAVEPEVLMTVHCVYDGDYPTGEDPFKELEELEGQDKIIELQQSEPLEPDEKEKRPENAPPVITARSLPAPAAPSMPLRHQTFSFLEADVCHSYEKEHMTLFAKESERPKPPMVGISQYPRGRWGNVMVEQFTASIIDEVQKEAIEAAKDMLKHGGTRISIGCWPFTKTMFDKATRSAWPHERNKPNCPIIVYFTWEEKKHDEHWVNAMKKTIKSLRAKVHQKQSNAKDLPFFVSTALAEPEVTTIEDLYRGNLDELKKLRTEYDPNDIMRLAGGFRIPLASKERKGTE